MADVALSALPALVGNVPSTALIPITDVAAANASKNALPSQIAPTLEALLNRPVIYFAASNATAVEIAYALPANRLDGTNDQVEINTALASGGVVMLSSGTFSIADTGSTPITDGGGSAKVFARGDTILKLANSSSALSVLTISAVNDFEWHGGVFDGNRANNTTSLTGVITTSGSSNNCIIEGVTVKNSDGRGMSIDGTGTTQNYLTIRNCTVQDCDEQGIQITREYVIVESCIIRDCGTETVDGADGAHQGIKVIASHCELIDNRITNIGGKGIECIGGSVTELIHHIKIVGNTVQKATRVGIHCHFASMVTVVGNESFNNHNNGIDFNYVIGAAITGNVCCFNGSPRGDSTYYGLEGSGIFLFRVADVTVTGNTCKSNSQGQIAGDPRSGIRISAASTDTQSTDKVTITGNTCNDRRVTGDFTCLLNGGITSTATTITVDTLSSATMTYDGHFTMVVDSEAIVVIGPTTDNDGYLTAGTWTVIRARASLNANNIAATHSDNATLTRQITQKYGVDIKALTGDTTHINNFIILGNIVTPNLTGGVNNDYSATATFVNTNNL